ncbi:unnamed protein product [Bursaphelenchus okinawaensis]|uniref:Tubulin-specific chaperone D n=1 Tax=Bursaphelenchus okinawaensis TaxID=465554 RepID=A0A811JTI1_9BILA|nr:unnamed protein product [Bursaphelenchus okinawaensis]CAG9082579.1 unnamed protein product [Bursaphelenchus okinawaensis]
MSNDESGRISASDYLFEEGVFGEIDRMEKDGVAREEIVNNLLKGYNFNGKLCTLIGDLTKGLDESTSDECASCFEDSAYKMVTKTFQPDDADKIFDMEDGVEWLPDLISHRPWRKLIFELSEQYPQCLMLNLAVKIISDAGFQNEINNVCTAANQVEIFSKVFATCVLQLVKAFQVGENTQEFQKALDELLRVVCYDEHTYYYAQAALKHLSQTSDQKVVAVCHQISQILRTSLKDKVFETTALMLYSSQESGDDIPSEGIQAILDMVSKKTLSPADVLQLYQVYFDPNPPPAEIIRDSVLVKTLLNSLFNVNVAKLSLEYRSRYVYLLAYAASVGEVNKNGMRIQTKAELDHVRNKMEELLDKLETADDLVSILPDVIKLIELPVLALGILSYVESIVLRDDVMSEPQTVHLVLIDHVATLQSNMRHRVFRLLCRLYECQSSKNEVAELVVSRQKVVIDRFIHLFSCGYVLPVLELIPKWYEEGTIDVSLVRYFGIEVLEMTTPPYSDDFCKRMYPLITRSEIFDKVTTEKQKYIAQFIGYVNIMTDDVSTVIGCEPVALTAFHINEIFKCIDNVEAISTTTQLTTTYERLEHVLAIYTNKFVLFPIVPKVVNKLVQLVEVKPPPLNKKSEVAIMLFYIFSKYVGFKQTTKYLPVEVDLLTVILDNTIHYGNGNSVNFPVPEVKDGIFCGLKIWLLILIKNPFDLRNFLRTSENSVGLDAISYRIKQLIDEKNAVKDGPKLDFITLAILYTRNADNGEALRHFFQNILNSKQNPREKLNSLKTLNYIFKLGKRQELQGFVDDAIAYCSSCYKDNNSSSLLTNYCLKVYQRNIMTLLDVRLANWRYQKKNKSIEESLGIEKLSNLNGSAANGSTVDQAHLTMVKDVLVIMKNCLSSESNDVRWGAAKGIARIISKLPVDYTVKMVSEMTSQLNDSESSCYWNGICLLLAELTTRGCILPETMPSLLKIVKKALLFDLGGFMNTTETNVRDSACYICWSLARAYSKEMFLSQIPDFSNLLVCTALFDRDVNVRRAASATFQEHVGRHGGFSNGIQILVIIDFSDVALIGRCYKESCVKVAQYREYLRPMLDFLVFNKVPNWNTTIRELTSSALRLLSPMDSEYVLENLLPHLSTSLNNTTDITLQHGYLFALSACISAVSTKLTSDDTVIKAVLHFTDTHRAQMHNRSMENVTLLERAMASIFKCLLDADLVDNHNTHMQWMSTVEYCLLELIEVKKPEESTQDILLNVIQSIFLYWKRHTMFDVAKDHLQRFKNKLSTADAENTFTVYALIVERVCSFMVEEKDLEDIQRILKEHILRPSEQLWINARISALKALVCIYGRTGGQTQLDTLLECLDKCYKDQTVSKNGDIGRYVREAALRNTLTILLKAAQYNNLGQQQVVNVTTNVLGLLFDAVDKNVRVSHEVIQSILDSNVDVNDKDRLLSLFNSEHIEFATLVPLLEYDAYRNHLLKCAIFGLGSLVVTTSNNSWQFLYNYVTVDSRKTDIKFMEGFTRVVYDCYASVSTLDDKIRYCRALSILIERRAFELYEADPCTSICFVQLCESIILLGKSKCGVKLKHTSLKTVASFIMLNYSSDVALKARKTLSSFLTSPYSALRSQAAELLQHYLSLIDESVYEREDVQKALAILADLNWTKPKEELQEDAAIVQKILSF